MGGEEGASRGRDGRTARVDREGRKVFTGSSVSGTRIYPLPPSFLLPPQMGLALAWAWFFGFSGSGLPIKDTGARLGSRLLNWESCDPGDFRDLTLRL